MVIMRSLFLIGIALISYNSIYSQGCCSGGAGNPIAGGAATGVLQKNQVDTALIYQHAESNKFYTGDSYADPLYNKFHSNYLFFRVDYGLSEKLTLSVAS